MQLLQSLSVIVITTNCIIASSCSSSESNTKDSSILFEPCEDTTSLVCGKFEVPLVHGSTDSRQICIDVARLPGIGIEPREPLLLNVSDPGSGIELLREIALFGGLSDSIRERYDIIGIDQRDVRKPSRVDCDRLGRPESLPYPRDRNELQVLVNDATLLADAVGGVYLSSDHLGHTVVFIRQDDCVASIVVEFLIDKKLPEEDVTCN